MTWYNFASVPNSGFHGTLNLDTLWDSIFVLEGLPELQTLLNPVKIMADTADTIDIIFCLL
ncbi:Tn3 family transposase [Citrobacter freundii]|nr:Tn3 family transposase [Citrobacter freundii]MBJ8872169.1 Tn3 family transposase [Citrobacter braakii]MBJ8903801.1 Tn3 family transposase [Citrobacter braakii]MBJ8907523.1 Tn3 family transposase [Citrobacter braakii]MBJ8922271.1 Tn3 family transposase [Citrobacter braakii]